MIIRDGRRQVHDLGPRKTFSFTLMPLPPGASAFTDGTGWNGDKHHAFFNDRPRKAPEHSDIREATCPLDGKRFTITTAHANQQYCSARCKKVIQSRRYREAVRTRQSVPLQEVEKGAA